MDRVTITPTITEIPEDVEASEDAFFVEEDENSSGSGFFGEEVPEDEEGSVLGDDVQAVESILKPQDPLPTETVALTTTSGETMSLKETAEAQSLLLTMILTLVIFGAAIVMIKHRDLYTNMHKSGKQTRKRRRAVIGMFILFGLLSTGAMVLQLIRVNGYALAFLQ